MTDAVAVWARLVEADMDPSRVDVAARAVKYDVIPHFGAQRSAHRGLWMANRSSGDVLVVTIWLDRDALDAGRSADGAGQANVVERTGMTTRVVHTMEVLGSTEPDPTRPAVRWAQATWIEGVATDGGDVLTGHRRSSGFCGGYWFGETGTGAGLALSLWDGPRSPPRLEEGLGGRVSRSTTYESLGVATP